APTGRPRRCPAAGGRRDMGGADETDTQVPFGCVQWNETETTSANYTEASSVYQVEGASGNGLKDARLVAGPGEVGSDEHGGTPAPDEGGRAPEPRAAAGRRPGGVHRAGGGRHLAGGDRAPGRGGDRHAVPPLPRPDAAAGGRVHRPGGGA